MFFFFTSVWQPMMDSNHRLEPKNGFPPDRWTNGLTFVTKAVYNNNLVGPERFELSTKRLKVSCSTG